jgi:hypothetical protein
MHRLLNGIVDADPIALGVTVGLLVVLAVAFALRRARGARP